MAATHQLLKGEEMPSVPAHEKTMATISAFTTFDVVRARCQMR